MGINFTSEIHYKNKNRNQYLPYDCRWWASWAQDINPQADGEIAFFFPFEAYSKIF